MGFNLIILICLTSLSAYGFLPAAAIPAASSTGPLAPFVIGGVAAFFALKKLWSNPLGDLKVELTKIYENSQDGLEENLARYLEEPASFLAQKERLSYFDNVWKYLHEISLKTAQGIISWNERQRTGRWPWEVYYRDPIANDQRLTSGGLQVQDAIIPIAPPVQSGSVAISSESEIVQFFPAFLAFVIIVTGGTWLITKQ